MILKRLEVGMFASNCYILGSEAAKEGFIIDPGDEGRRILDTVEKMQLNIKLIVLTHGHIDHISGVDIVKRSTKAPVAAHTTEVDLLHGIGHVDLGFTPHYPDVTPDKLLKDGDSIDVGDLHFKVIHTPGHSQGGICLYGHEIVFTGDTLFCQSIGRTDLGGDYDQLIESIQTRLMKLPDKTVVYPGHGPESTIGSERKLNPFLRGTF